MALGGKITGITSEEVKRVESEITQLQTETIMALGEYYAADTNADRNKADEKIKLACAKGISARAKLGGLQDVQADAKDFKHQVGSWVATIRAASV